MRKLKELGKIKGEKYLSAPPIASTISLQSFIGGGNGLGSRPRIKPKSTWKRRPSSLRRRLSRCLQTKVTVTSICTPDHVSLVSTRTPKTLNNVVYSVCKFEERGTQLPTTLFPTGLLRNGKIKALIQVAWCISKLFNVHD